MAHFLLYALALAPPALAIIAALKDLTSYTIPNWISLSLIALFAVAAAVSGLELQDIGLRVAIGVAGLLLSMGMFAAGWIGGGDAKFMATSVLWLGWPATVPFLVVTALCGGALAVSLLALRSVWLRAVVGHGPNWLTRLATPDQAVPYGVAIGLGMLVSYPNSGLFQALVG